MNENIFLDMLNQNSVSIRKQQIVVAQDGKEYVVGEIWRRAYSNSIQGRQQIENKVSEPYKSAIFSVWGDTPTIIENTQ